YLAERIGIALREQVAELGLRGHERGLRLELAVAREVHRTLVPALGGSRVARGLVRALEHDARVAVPRDVVHRGADRERRLGRLLAAAPRFALELDEPRREARMRPRHLPLLLPVAL